MMAIILGAGMAGCLAGVMDPSATIFEAAESLPAAHKAVLRFRSDVVSKATGIDFKKVTVRKSIWYENKEVLPTPRIANMYSCKVTGEYYDRSIWDIEPATRYVAPDNFHQMIGDMCGERIKFGNKVKNIDSETIETNKILMLRDGCPIISTMPMHILASVTGIELKEQFKFKEIYVTRLKVNNSHVYQTVYFPNPHIGLYRATLTGEDLILESIAKDVEVYAAINALAINGSVEISGQEETKQQYGKISPIDNNIRQKFMLDQSINNNVYSLGRFACWRNILLDDVYDDFYKIKRMINSSKYSNYLGAHK